MKQSEELRMTYSGIINQNGQKIVRVSFERGNDYAKCRRYYGTCKTGESASGLNGEKLILPLPRSYVFYRFAWFPHLGHILPS